MLNEKSIKAAEQARRGEFTYPLYGSYCFAHIPDTILSLLHLPHKKALPKDTFHLDAYDDVVLLFVDGFGFEFFQKFQAGLPFLDRFMSQGIVSKITSQFPSTTSAHVSCINTGLPVAETGFYEWFQYEPEIDKMFAPLLFSLAGDKEADTLKNTDASPKNIYPFKTFYQKLKESDVQSYVFFHDPIVNSVYSSFMTEGAIRVGYSKIDEGLSSLRSLLEKPSSQKRYFYFYAGDIDSAGHRNGTYSDEFAKSTKEIFTAFENWIDVLSSNRKIALLVTADHGMIDVDPKNTIYLNEKMPSITDVLKKNRKGKLLVPAGSCRDFFLHVEDGHLKETDEKLKVVLEGRATIKTTKLLVEEGVFGTPNLSKRLLDRIGNLVILPHEHEGVWWHEKNRFGQHFYAVHGGLSKQEMESIFLFLSL